MADPTTEDTLELDPMDELKRRLAQIELMKQDSYMDPTLAAVSSLPPTPQGSKDMQQMLREKLVKSMAGQDQSLDMQRSLLAAKANAPVQADLSPTLNMIANYTGNKNFASNYKGPENQDVTSALGAYTKEQNTLTDQQQKILKDELSAKTQAGALSQAAKLAHEDRLERQDFRNHQITLANIQKNPLIAKRIQQYQNLDNQMNLIKDADYLTPQMIHDTQQLLLTNMGIGGQSTGAERYDRFIHNAGWKIEDVLQQLTGNPADINKNSKLVKLIRELGGLEQKNARDTIMKNLTILSPGYNNTTYKRRPDMDADRQEVIKAIADSVATPNEFAVNPRPYAPALRGLGENQKAVANTNLSPAQPPMSQDAFIEAYLAKKKGTSK